MSHHLASYYHGAGLLSASSISIMLIAILMAALMVTLLAIKNHKSIINMLAIIASSTRNVVRGGIHN